MHYVTHAITLQSKTKNNSFYQYKKALSNKRESARMAMKQKD